MNQSEWATEVTRRDCVRDQLMEAERKSETPEQHGWRMALKRIYDRNREPRYDWQQLPVLLQWLAGAKRKWAAPKRLNTN